MKVTTEQESRQVSPQSEPDRFTGLAGFRVLHVADAPSETADSAATSPSRGAQTWNAHAGNVAIVRYEAGARSHWHSHSGGQLVYVVEGEGWVQARGEDARSVGRGDAVSFAPGEVHWHGAKPGAPMAHIAVTAGRPTWFEESPAPTG
jgi:quercetin dioxygenase-like cupin family protein